MFKKIKSLLLENRTLRQTVAKNTFWLGISHIGGRLLRAVIVIYAARVLGASEWGVFSYSITLVAFLTVFADIGLNIITVREVARAGDRWRESPFISTAFAVKLALTALGVIVIVFAAPSFTTIEGARKLLPLFAFIFAFDALRDNWFSIIRGRERMEQEALLYLATNAAIVVLGFSFLLTESTARSFAYAYALGTALGMAATAWAVRDYLRVCLSRFTRRLVLPLLKTAWPLAVSGVLGLLMLNTDILILSWLRSTEEVGYYSAVNRIVQLLYTFPALLATSVMPVFARLARRDDEIFRKVLERIVSISLMIAIPLGVGGALVSDGLTSFVFGPSYSPGAPSLQILLLTLLFDFPAVILSQALFAYNEQRKLVLYAVTGGMLNVALDLILIPHFGIVGSAWATLTAQVVSNVYLWRTLKAVNYFTIMPYLKRSFISTIVMAFAVLGVSISGLHVLFAVVPGGLVYLTSLVLLREPLLREARLILRSPA